MFDSGRIEELLVQPGTQVPVGAPLALYTPAGGESSVAAPAAPTPAMRAVEPRTASAARAAPVPTSVRAREGPARRTHVSPAARRRAEELGVDLANVSATGPQGAITLEDVERTAAAARGPITDMRSVIGQAMSRSKREIPHYYLATTIDMTPATAWLEQWNARHGVTERLLNGALLVKAVARALERYPELNGFWLDGRFEASREINVGIAIRLRRGGLVAPGLTAANELSLTDLMQQLQALVLRARAGRLRRTEITNATITLSSLGEGGVETLYPIIYPPQVAIVGFGGVVTKPWAADGKIILAPLITSTLSADHRVSDGHRGSQFLSDIARLLQHPEEL
jgi:pyruvate dehydrogenase E2 component (dihydrolipoamide acetyltransferase)